MTDVCRAFPAKWRPQCEVAPQGGSLRSEYSSTDRELLCRDAQLYWCEVRGESLPAVPQSRKTPRAERQRDKRQVEEGQRRWSVDHLRSMPVIYELTRISLVERWIKGPRGEVINRSLDGWMSTCGEVPET